MKCALGDRPVLLAASCTALIVAPACRHHYRPFRNNRAGAGEAQGDVQPSEAVPKGTGMNPLSPSAIRTARNGSRTCQGPPASADGGIFNVPAIVLAPPVSVMVKGALRFPVEAVSEGADIVPLQMFVSVTCPFERLALKPRLTVALVTLNLVLMVAAGAAAHTSNAKAILEKVRFIGPLESSTRRNTHTPVQRATLRVYLWHKFSSTLVRRYLWLKPPSIASTWPVTKFDAFRKYTTASATSAGVPPRSAGVFSIIRLPRSSMSSNGSPRGQRSLP